MAGGSEKIKPKDSVSMVLNGQPVEVVPRLENMTIAELIQYVLTQKKVT